MSWIIYKHTNKINGLSYIGQTSQKAEERWRDGKGYIGSSYFFNAILKYGWDNFSHEIIEDNIQTQKLANEREQYWIFYYHTWIGDPECKGYNLTSGGSNYIRTEEMRKKLSEKAKINSLQYWATHEKERQERGQTVQCIETGLIFPSYKDAGEWCGLKNYKNSFLMYFRGERLSCGKHPETKECLHWVKLDKNNNKIENDNQNLDKTKKIKTNNKVVKKVKCLETGVVFNSIVEACNWCNLKNSSSIINQIQGIRNSAGKHPETKIPLHWAYYKEKE